MGKEKTPSCRDPVQQRERDVLEGNEIKNYISCANCYLRFCVSECLASRIRSRGYAMRITRLYTGPDNQSHFDEIEIPAESRGPLGFFTDPTNVKAFFFREVPAKYHYPWHNVVCREYVITLDGRAEIEVSSGEKRRFGKGEVLLAEDISGQGHKTRVIGKKTWRQAFITLP
jgi:hypothetical protein